jgi:hypothetical protein
MSKTSTRGKRDNPYLIDDLVVKMHRSAAGTAWRWRTEMTVLVTMITVLIALSFAMPLAWPAVRFAALVHVTSLAWGATELAIALGTLFGVPATRRFVIRRFWCVVSRHRFQRLCWEARLHTRSGRLPVVLWTRPTKVGERLTVWCRAGIAAEDFEQHTGELRAACYAREARVTRNIRWSQLVTIDIIRRDTLAATHQVHSPLARLSTVYADVLSPPPVPAGADGDTAPLPWPQEPITNPN